jgi:hypothetical protein
MVIALTHSELEHLYNAPGLDQYRAEAVLARLLGGGSLPALCYNLRAAPGVGETNPEYALQLQRVLRNLNFPAEYVDSVTGC